MTVYIVEYNYPDYETLRFGVFSTRELAKAAVEKIVVFNKQLSDDMPEIHEVVLDNVDFDPKIY